MIFKDLEHFNKFLAVLSRKNYSLFQKKSYLCSVKIDKQNGAI